MNFSKGSSAVANEFINAYKALYDRLNAIEDINFLGAIQPGDTININNSPGASLMLVQPESEELQALDKYSVMHFDCMVRVYEDGAKGEFSQESNNGVISRGSLWALQKVMNAIMTGGVDDCTAGGAWLEPPIITVKKYARGVPAGFTMFELGVKICSTRFRAGTL